MVPLVAPSEIEAVTVERWAILLYSHYNWTCAPQCAQCGKPYCRRRCAEADAGKPALNVFPYAISY